MRRHGVPRLVRAPQKVGSPVAGALVVVLVDVLAGALVGTGMTFADCASCVTGKGAVFVVAVE